MLTINFYISADILWSETEHVSFCISYYRRIWIGSFDEVILKRRIMGPDGHLSNQQGGELLAAVSHVDLNLVVLAHLSETNNHPDKAHQTAAEVLGNCDLGKTDILIGRQNEPGPMIEL